jgi:RNA polymerase sigma-70 factor (ECF subfamily)
MKRRPINRDKKMQKKKINENRSNEITRNDLVEIYETYSPQIFKYAVRLLGDKDLAEDCVSETFSRFLKTLQMGVGPNDNLRAYLYKIAHNWIMDYYRQRKPEKMDVEINDIPSSIQNPELKVSEQDEIQKVREALLGLPEDQLRVIVMRFYEDKSHEDTALELGKSDEATRALQYRALKGLRGLLLQSKA